ncbi:MAG TPA: hypothetical protein VFR55_10480 [Dehalococcoidia bacterium]|nr:hypothetical protein [Dehalococcoidia bacterium]
MDLQVSLQPIDRYIQQWAKEFNAPGLTIAVTDRAQLADYCGCPYYRAFTP